MKLCKYYNSNMKTLCEYCKALYRLDGCGCGGPLHILLDDGNYNDHDIQFCIDECSKHPNDTVATLGTIICREYQKMSMKERAVFNAYLWGHSIECKYMFCDTYCLIAKEADETKKSMKL